MLRVTFNISQTPLFVFDVDLKKKQVRLLNQPNEQVADLILAKNERTYAGLERRLQYFAGNDLKLPQQLKQVREKGFKSDFQYNLNLSLSFTDTPISA